MESIKSSKKETLKPELMKPFESIARNIPELEKEESLNWKFIKLHKDKICDPPSQNDFVDVVKENKARSLCISESDYKPLLVTLSEDTQKAIRELDRSSLETLNLCYLHSEVESIKKMVKEIEGETSALKPEPDKELRYHFNYMKYYKTEECRNKAPHNEVECFAYHSKTEARRAVQMITSSETNAKVFWNYYPAKCTGINCKNLQCKYAHTWNEIRYHPLAYKTLLCIGKCIGVACPYVHDATEHIRDVRRLYEKVEPFPNTLKAYKTFKCTLKTCNNAACTGYHTKQERRRNGTYKYYSIMCGKLMHGNRIGNYKVCPKGDKCTYCHSLNELYYHEDVYKAFECRKIACKLGKEICYGKHTEEKATVLNTLDDYKVAIQYLQELKQSIQLQVEGIEEKSQNWKCCECLELMQKEFYVNKVPGCNHCICSECYQNNIRKECIVCGAKADLYEKILLVGIIKKEDIKFVQS